MLTRTKQNLGFIAMLLFLFAIVNGAIYYYTQFVVTDESFRLSSVPEISAMESPSGIDAGKPINMRWRILGDQGRSEHMAVHFGPSSIPNPSSLLDYPKESQFICEEGCSIPGDYSTQMVIDEPGTYYYRTHATIDGKDIWSAEHEITVRPAAAPIAIEAAGTQEAVAEPQVIGATGEKVEAGISQAETAMPAPSVATVVIDGGFAPSTLVIAKGGKVTWINSDAETRSLTGPGFDSGMLAEGDTFSHIFMDSGILEYSAGDLKGSVIVQG